MKYLFTDLYKGRAYAQLAYIWDAVYLNAIKSKENKSGGFGGHAVTLDVLKWPK